jgi:hypothetical protein
MFCVSKRSLAILGEKEIRASSFELLATRTGEG